MLGPWRRSVVPGRLTLQASLRKATWAPSFVIGDEFKGEVALVDRLGNPLSKLPKGLKLGAALVRATALTKALAARQRGKTTQDAKVTEGKASLAGGWMAAAAKAAASPLLSAAVEALSQAATRLNTRPASMHITCAFF